MFQVWIAGRWMSLIYPFQGFFSSQQGGFGCQAIGWPVGVCLSHFCPQYLSSLPLFLFHSCQLPTWTWLWSGGEVQPARFFSAHAGTVGTETKWQNSCQTVASQKLFWIWFRNSEGGREENKTKGISEQTSSTFGLYRVLIISAGLAGPPLQALSAGKQ